MVKIFDKNKQPQTQNREVHRANRRAIVFYIVAVIMATVACGGRSPLWGIMDDKYENESPNIVIIVEDSEPTTEVLEPATPKQAEPKLNPTSPSVELPVSEQNTGGTSEFAVTATDFSCICNVDGNLIQELNIKDNQLEIIDPDGNIRVYDQIGENTYKTSWMGYYILVVDGQDTKVDEEKSVVIILTDTGYVMEHYSGSEGSPCCFHTFSQTE